MIIDIQLIHWAIQVPPLALSSLEIGSVLEFQGLVREQEEGIALSGLFYEAYEPMAQKRLRCHCEALQKQYPISAVYFIHRLGWVPVGEASLFVRVLSSHRAEGLQYLAELVIRMKQDVPIWKQRRQSFSAPAVLSSEEDSLLA